MYPPIDHELFHIAKLHLYLVYENEYIVEQKEGGGLCGLPLAPGVPCVMIF
jgi:hypothetical protein